MANTLTKITTVTVGSGGASSIDFTSIPQTYTDLVIKTSARNTSTSTTMYIEFNGSGGTAYSVRLLYGDGSAAGSTSSSSRANIKNDGGADDSGYTASTFASSDIYIPNYTSSNYKSVSADAVPENNATTTYVALTAGLWANTAAISSIKLTLYAGNFAQYSTATLYGVSNNTTGNSASATGGTITYNGGYVYHTFTSSGTFTPSKSLICDVLTIAGGGGGGFSRAGGGGAGGIAYYGYQSLSATGYSVTVGGGGAGSSSTYGTNGDNSQFHTFTAAVGGGGGASAVSTSGRSGGSGGGSVALGPVGTATNGQGYNGGIGSDQAPAYGGGGGGGAGAAGGSGSSSLAGNGGVGSSAYSQWGYSTSSGQNVSGVYYYAGGGGGGRNNVGTASTGGSGGGGNGGGTSNQAGFAGTANTGGGGGAGANDTIGVAGGNGGSGIVIIRYLK